MNLYIQKIFKTIDWPLFLSAVFLSIAGIITMNSFAGESKFFTHQIIWLCVSIAVFFGASFVNWRFFRRTEIVSIAFAVCCGVLLLLFIVGSVFKGAKSWFNLGFFAIQPVDFAKLILVLVLSKYFSRRHVEIANIRHIIVSGIYSFIMFLLILLQPDFGSSVIIFFVWFTMILVSGVSKKHIFAVVFICLASFAGMWFFVFKDYQKLRIVSFINPLADVRGAGYNAYQSMIAVGSGEIMGKGVGLGSQSKLKFLPEYETDFIFAAFSEEWGFIGVVIIMALYGIIFWRIIESSRRGVTNFEALFGIGLLSIFLAHFTIHVGMNIGILPVTGTPLPFMSYGGSHLVAEFLGLGILAGMGNYSRPINKNDLNKEIVISRPDFC